MNNSKINEASASQSSQRKEVNALIAGFSLEDHERAMVIQYYQAYQSKIDDLEEIIDNQRNQIADLVSASHALLNQIK